MPRFLGLLPVSLLGLAVVVSAVVGLRLGQDSPARRMADELGCAHVSSSHPQPGVARETCSYHGDQVVILSLDQGSHTFTSQDVLSAFVLAPGGSSLLVIACERRPDCAAIHQRVGGELSSGPLLGLSLVVD